MTFLPQETIRLKRDGGALDDEAIGDFVAGIGAGTVTEAQVAAFCMATFFRGMSMAERVALTRAMTASGRTLSWGDVDLPGPILDKHSTGGVGDTVSLMLAPLVAAAGGFVPMISGRGLGHTGGTLDKLESIPGYDATPSHDLFRRTVREVGCAIIGQTADLAPADKVIYGVRDVTATVESIPLITASILSKKLAAGLGGLVMDVKTGSGAFMPDFPRSRELAESIAAVAAGAGLPTVALVTAMDQRQRLARLHHVAERHDVGEADRMVDRIRARQVFVGVLHQVARAAEGGDHALEGLRGPAVAEHALQLAERGVEVCLQSAEDQEFGCQRHGDAVEAGDAMAALEMLDGDAHLQRIAGDGSERLVHGGDEGDGRKAGACRDGGDGFGEAVTIGEGGAAVGALVQARIAG